MNTQYTRHLSMIRRALSIGTLCLVASFGVAHAEDFAIPSARPVVDGMSTDDVKVVSAAHPGSANLITPNDWTYIGGPGHFFTDSLCRSQICF